MSQTPACLECGSDATVRDARQRDGDPGHADGHVEAIRRRVAGTCRIGRP